MHSNMKIYIENKYRTSRSAMFTRVG